MLHAFKYDISLPRKKNFNKWGYAAEKQSKGTWLIHGWGKNLQKLETIFLESSLTWNHTQVWFFGHWYCQFSIFIFLQLHYRHMRGQHVIPKSFSTLQPVLLLLERLFACTIDFSSLVPYILTDIPSSGLNNLLTAWNFRHFKSWRLACSCFGATNYNSWCNFCCLIMEYKMHFQSRNTFVSIAWWIPPKHSHVYVHGTNRCIMKHCILCVLPCTWYFTSKDNCFLSMDLIPFPKFKFIVAFSYILLI